MANRNALLLAGDEVGFWEKIFTLHMAHGPYGGKTGRNCLPKTIDAIERADKAVRARRARLPEPTAAGPYRDSGEPSHG
jgi:hypothetical protein